MAYNPNNNINYGAQYQNQAQYQPPQPQYQPQYPSQAPYQPPQNQYQPQVAQFNNQTNMYGIQQQLVSMLGIVATDCSQLELAHRLPLGKVETRLCLVQRDHGILDLVLIRPQEARHADDSLQLCVDLVCGLARVFGPGPSLEELLVTEG